jgi:CDP-diacylglycerol--serine O-phosphatidyltransferase
MYLSFETGLPFLRDPMLVSLWLVVIAFLTISSLPTVSWGKLRPRRQMRLEVIALFGLLVGGGLLTEPWWSLIAISTVYLALIPVGWMLYARVKRQRARRAAEQAEAGAA